MEKIYYTGLLTKNQSLQLLFAMEIAHELPKKKETVYIVAPIGHRDYTKILISVNAGKSTENKTLCDAVANSPYLKGGTGGFILIESNEMIIHRWDTSRIEAKGGYYCGF